MADALNLINPTPRVRIRGTLARWVFALLLAVMIGFLWYIRTFAGRSQVGVVEAAYPIQAGPQHPIERPKAEVTQAPVVVQKPQAERPQATARPAQTPPKQESAWEKKQREMRLAAAWGRAVASSNEGNGGGSRHGIPALRLPQEAPQTLEIPSQHAAGTGQGGHESGMSMVQHYPTPYVIPRGWTIEARMNMPTNSDAPGQVTATVLRDVMDGITGEYQLIPAGAVLVGVADARTRFGQQRVQVSWDQLNFPNGTYLTLPGMPGADRSGLAGVPGAVDNHLLATAGTAALLTITGATSRMAMYGAYSSGTLDPQEALAAEAGRELQRGGQRAFGSGLTRPTTVTTKAGERILVLVTRALVFEHPYEDGVKSEEDYAQAE